jgi:TatD DNase family protein
MKLIDTHAHIDFPVYNEDRLEVIRRAREAGLEYIVDVGADLPSSHRAVELSQVIEGVYATVGIHPHDADKLDDKAMKILKDLSKADRVVAIGEIGLDFYYDNSPRDIQKDAFRRQLGLAREIGLPVVIHTRDADEDTLSILKGEHIEKIGGILHCFNSDIKMANECLNLNLYIAFGGMITFKKSESLRQVVKEVPLNRILIETDSPYLAPNPYRGKRNEPSYVRYVADKIAEIKGISLEEVAQYSTDNAKKVYRIGE